MASNEQLRDVEQGRTSASKPVAPLFVTFGIRDFNHVAEFLNRDPDSDLWVFRRFGKLHLLNIQWLQQRLAELEYELENKISHDTKKDVADKLHLDIHLALKEYDEALSSLVRLKSYKRPENHILDHIEDWSGKYSGLALSTRLCIKGDRAERRNYIDELASIGAIQKSWIHRFIDRHDRLRSLFEKKPAKEEETNPTLIYYESSVQRVESLLLHASFWFLLICPILVFPYTNSRLGQLLVLAGFLLVASLLSASLLNAPNMSSLVLVAGYAAILVVFVSNGVGH